MNQQSVNLLENKPEQDFENCGNNEKIHLQPDTITSTKLPHVNSDSSLQSSFTKQSNSGKMGNFFEINDLNNQQKFQTASVEDKERLSSNANDVTTEDTFKNINQNVNPMTEKKSEEKKKTSSLQKEVNEIKTLETQNGFNDNRNVNIPNDYTEENTQCMDNSPNNSRNLEMIRSLRLTKENPKSTLSVKQNVIERNEKMVIENNNHSLGNEGFNTQEQSVHNLEKSIRLFDSSNQNSVETSYEMKYLQQQRSRTIFTTEEIRQMITRMKVARNGEMQENAKIENSNINQLSDNTKDSAVRSSTFNHDPEYHEQSWKNSNCDSQNNHNQTIIHKQKGNSSKLDIDKDAIIENLERQVVNVKFELAEVQSRTDQMSLVVAKCNQERDMMKRELEQLRKQYENADKQRNNNGLGSTTRYTSFSSSCSDEGDSKLRNWFRSRADGQAESLTETWPRSNKEGRRESRWWQTVDQLSSEIGQRVDQLKIAQKMDQFGLELEQRIEPPRLVQTIVQLTQKP